MARYKVVIEYVEDGDEDDREYEVEAESELEATKQAEAMLNEKEDPDEITDIYVTHGPY